MLIMSTPFGNAWNLRLVAERLDRDEHFAYIRWTMPYGVKKVLPYFSKASLNKLRVALHDMRMNQQVFAEEIGTHPQTVSKWFNRKQRLPQIVAKYITMRLAYTRLLARLEKRGPYLYLRGEPVGEKVFDPVKPVEDSHLFADVPADAPSAPEPQPVKEIAPIDPFS